MSLELSPGKTWLIVACMVLITIALGLHVITNTDDVNQEKQSAQLLVDRHEVILQYLEDINDTNSSNR